jgi:uncharacterized protein (DUF305 family)
VPGPLQRGLVAQWSDGPGPKRHEDADMPGVIDAATMTRLESLKGAEFDILWPQSMIGHHQGAIEMATVEVANGGNTGAIEMAKNIVTTQQAEIDHMTKMLGG